MMGHTHKQAVEAALSMHLEKYATTLGSKEQLAIAEFADALLVIPRTLSVNAAQVCGLLLRDCCVGFGGMEPGKADCLAHVRVSLSHPPLSMPTSIHPSIRTARAHTHTFSHSSPPPSTNNNRTRRSWWRACGRRTTKRRARGTPT